MKTNSIIAIISITATVAIVAMLIFRPPAAQFGSQTQQPSSPQVQVVQVSEISAHPANYSGKNIQTEGGIRKDFSLATPYVLSDGKVSLFLRSKGDMDRYVGLTVKVTGIVKRYIQSSNLPATWIDVQSIQPIDGEPSFYLEMEKHGIFMENEDFGHRTLDRLLVYDNSRTLTVYSAKSAFLQRTTLPKERVEEVRQMLLATDIFSIQQHNYNMSNVEQGDTFTYRIKVIMRMGNELKEKHLKWEEPSPFTEKLQKLEATFNNILKVDSP